MTERHEQSAPPTDGYVRVGDLRSHLADLPDEMLVVLSKDGEGNGYSPLAAAGKGRCAT